MKSPRTARIRSILFLLTINIFFSACSPAPATALPRADVQPPGTTTGWLQIYFTDPEAPHAADYTGGPDRELAAALDRARLSVEAAAYSLNLWSVRDALIRAERRGVQVRMVMESDNMDGREVQDLQEAGIPILGDQQEGLMHDKFLVIDRAEVWTGSMNYTVSGVYQDNNNLVRMRSHELAQDYTREFETMFSGGFFGPEKHTEVPFPRLTIEGTPVEVYFSPQDGAGRRIRELVRAARQNVYFLAFSFTSDEIGNALIERSRAGVRVFGVMDDGQVKSNQGTEFDRFRQAGMEVRLDGNTDGLMHHKVIIIDRQIVITGSYNFTNSAEASNDENLVVFFDPGVAAQYVREFQRIYARAQP